MVVVPDPQEKQGKNAGREGDGVPAPFQSNVTRCDEQEIERAGQSKIGVENAPQHARHREFRPSSPDFAVDGKTVEAVEQVQQAIQDFDQATSTIDWSDWPEQFDYLIDFHYGRPRNPVPDLLTELHRGSFFSIFRIHAPRR